MTHINEIPEKSDHIILVFHGFDLNLRIAKSFSENGKEHVHDDEGHGQREQEVEEGPHAAICHVDLIKRHVT